MDLPGGYQGNFSLVVAPLPLHCCSAGDSLVPSVSPHPLSGTSTPSASSGESERRHNLRQNCEYVFSCIWPSTVGSPRGRRAGGKVGACHMVVKGVLCPCHSHLACICPWPQWRKQAEHIIQSLLERGRGWSTLWRQACTTATQKVLLFEL